MRKRLDLVSREGTNPESDYGALYREIMDVCDKYDDDTMHSVVMILISQRIAQLGEGDSEKIAKAMQETQIDIGNVVGSFFCD